MKKKQYPHYEIGERLSDLMYERNMTDEELANRIGKERKSICHYRHNESEMGVVTLMKICSVLNTTPKYLLYGR